MIISEIIRAFLREKEQVWKVGRARYTDFNSSKQKFPHDVFIFQWADNSSPINLPPRTFVPPYNYYPGQKFPWTFVPQLLPTAFSMYYLMWYVPTLSNWRVHKIKDSYLPRNNKWCRAPGYQDGIHEFDPHQGYLFVLWYEHKNILCLYTSESSSQLLAC